MLTAKRLALSAFLLLHLAAVGVWNLPEGAIKSAAAEYAGWYLMPTGQWQQWGMFAPEVAKDTQTLEAVVRDAHGLIRRYAFPRMMDRSAMDGFLGGFRHSKYANNVAMTEGVANREVAARHVARSMGLARSDYPVDVQLIYQIWPTNPPSAPADEPQAAPVPSVLETYRFQGPEEVAP